MEYNYDADCLNFAFRQTFSPENVWILGSIFSKEVMRQKTFFAQLKIRGTAKRKRPVEQETKVKELR